MLDGQILGKPGNVPAAIAQLRRASGRRVEFLTGLCLHDARGGRSQVEVVPFAVDFRCLGEAEIARYVARENPVDCAGSFKSEGLGVTLFERMVGEDPSALVGLPLIRLCALLRGHGLDLP